MSYYIKDSIIPVDEDAKWEFKAHRNFCSDEVPAWREDGTKICPSRAMAAYYKLKNANRTRQPISRNICGYLNSGKGGNIMLGVLDSGKIVGIPLSVLQRDHLLLSLEDALRRFKPRVPNEFIKVAFMKVIENVSEMKDTVDSKLCDPPWDIRRQPHQLRTSSLCWCDQHAMQRFRLGFMTTLYVVEVQVAPLHPNLRTPEVSAALARLMQEEMSPLLRLSWPAFTSEDGNLFTRVLNSLVKYTKEEITRFSNFQTEDFVRSELVRMARVPEGRYDPARIARLQALMPPGVVVSRAYLQSILDHAEPPDFTPPPLGEGEDYPDKQQASSPGGAEAKQEPDVNEEATSPNQGPGSPQGTPSLDLGAKSPTQGAMSPQGSRPSSALLANSPVQGVMNPTQGATSPQGSRPSSPNLRAKSPQVKPSPKTVVCQAEPPLVGRDGDLGPMQALPVGPLGPLGSACV